MNNIDLVGTIAAFVEQQKQHSCSSCGLNDWERDYIEGWNGACREISRKINEQFAGGKVKTPRELIEDVQYIKFKVDVLESKLKNGWKTI